jgi:hypothetical protein
LKRVTLGRAAIVLRMLSPFPSGVRISHKVLLKQLARSSHSLLTKYNRRRLALRVRDVPLSLQTAQRIPVMRNFYARAPRASSSVIVRWSNAKTISSTCPVRGSSGYLVLAMLASQQKSTR